METIQRIDTMQGNERHYNIFGANPLAGQNIVKQMNTPGTAIYVPEPDLTMNCTQLSDAKNGIVKRKPEILSISGASSTLNGALFNLIASSAVNSEIDRIL